MPEEEKADRVRGERERADTGHDRHVGCDFGLQAPGGLHQHTHAEGEHDHALERSGARPPGSASVEDVEAEAIDQRVAEHVERVAEERSRARGEAGAELDDKHGEVDREDCNQYATLPLAEGGDLAGFRLAALIHRLRMILRARGDVDQEGRAALS